jgi:hypothetical protein
LSTSDDFPIEAYQKRQGLVQPYILLYSENDPAYGLISPGIFEFLVITKNFAKLRIEVL